MRLINSRDKRQYKDKERARLSLLLCMSHSPTWLYFCLSSCLVCFLAIEVLRGMAISTYQQRISNDLSQRIGIFCSAFGFTQQQAVYNRRCNVIINVCFVLISVIPAKWRL